MHQLAAVYLTQNRQMLATLPLSSAEKTALTQHWSGNLRAAYDAYASLPARSCELIEADYVLVRVKIGLGLPQTLKHSNTPLARAVVAYARFSHFFWIDHAQAWREIATLAWCLLRAGLLRLLILPVFLAGHLLAIAGRKRVGLLLATSAYRTVTRLHEQGKPLPPLVHNIVLAAYPYTLFVSAAMDDLEAVVTEIMPRLTIDPYYQAIFLVSQLYCFAYTGHVARSEILAELFGRLHQGDRLLRYQPLAAVMKLLPLALRGYGDLVEQPFYRFMASFDAREHDPMINSHVHRAAALIQLALNRHHEAEVSIERAMNYRAQTRSFRAWLPHDRKILAWSREQQPFNPQRHRLMTPKVTTESLASLGPLLMRAITLLPKASQLDAHLFASEIAKILMSHVEWHQTTLSEQPRDGHLLSPQIRIGEYFLTFDGLPLDRMAYVDSVLSAVAPAIRTVEQALSTMRELQLENERASAHIAVASMTQMLAHDVRKPFSIFKIGLEQITRLEHDPSLRSRVIAMLREELGKASKQVEGMLGDILEVSSAETNLACETSSLQQILEASLAQTFQFDRRASVAFCYDFGHSTLLAVDPLKIQRVFTNLLDNARQALHGQEGLIWIKTRLVSTATKPMIEIIVGNDGPLIPAEALPELFDAFFTKGKPGGSGLGLAICRKIVTAHGGSIACRSAADVGTEFILQLPAVPDSQVVLDTRLPTSSREIREDFQALFSRPNGIASLRL